MVQKKSKMDEQEILVEGDGPVIVTKNAKSGALYLILAFFLGTLGIHNFYAGYIGRGVIQLLLTSMSFVFFFIPMLIVMLWVFLEICFVNKDAAGIPFAPAPVLRVVAIVLYLMSFLSLSMFYAPTNVIVIQQPAAVTTNS